MKSNFPNKLQRRTTANLYKHSPFEDFRDRTVEYTEIIVTLYMNLFKTMQHRLCIEPGMLSFFVQSKTYKWQSKHNSFYYNLLPQGYMFRLLRGIVRHSNEPTQDYIIHCVFWDPVALTVGGVIVM